MHYVPYMRKLNLNWLDIVAKRIELFTYCTTRLAGPTLRGEEIYKGKLYNII